MLNVINLVRIFYYYIEHFAYLEFILYLKRYINSLNRIINAFMRFYVFLYSIRQGFYRKFIVFYEVPIL